ncbi:MAG TPA: dickkopf-related protein [Myxococcota bacterium]|jgi:hypothetical protein|nr:dickkopf-related protein [Myxococcota bacterium]
MKSAALCRPARAAVLPVLALVLSAAYAALAAAGCSCSRSTELLPCSDTADCPQGEVCGLVSGACVAPYPCTTSFGCGGGAFCDPASGTCVPNASGGPCTSDANCLPGETCADGACRPGAPPPLVGLTDLVVDPPDVTLMALAGGTPVVQLFTATGTFDDGTSRDVTSEVGWAIDNAALGAIGPTGAFATSNAAGGAALVAATSGTISGTAMLTVLLSGEVTDPLATDLPADPASYFDPATPRMTGGAAAPAIVYPNDETLFPQNIYRILFQWNEGTGNDLFRVTFTSPVTDVTVYTTFDRWEPDETIWGWLAVSNAGGSADVTVEGVDTTDPSVVWASATISIAFSVSAVQGAIYYWSTGTAAVMKGTLSAPAPDQFYGIPPDTTCVACHTVARNGTRAAVGYGGHNLEVFDVPSRTVTIPAGTYDHSWATFNPDASLVLVAEGGTMRLLDAVTGVPVGAGDGVVPFPVAGLYPTMPDWAPSGDAVAVAASPSAADRHLNRASVYVIPYTAGTWGAPWPLIASAGTDDNNYYPSYSPDSAWVAYIHSEDNSDNQPTSRAMLVAAAGGTSIDLARLNDEVNNTLGVDLGNTMPTWAPTTSVGTNWIAFSSIRDYGKVLVGAGTDQLWVAGIDLGLAAAGADPSYPAFWLPFQDYLETNHRAYWAHDPTKKCPGGREYCDGLDNDCDGVVDEDCLPCKGTEICDDGEDNDCDGEVDEFCIPIP